jgi:hypothetical protein
MSYFREGHTAEKHRLELKILAKQADLTERLIEAKLASLQMYQPHLLGDDHIKAKERRVKEQNQKLFAEMTTLKGKMARAKGELERLSHQKGPSNRGDLDTLRRTYFQTGDASTFMWHVDFADIFGAQSGFDIVIANPPYVRVHRLSSSLKELLWQQFKCFKAKADLYCCFVERSIDLLRIGGNICFICSDGWQRLDSYDTLRDYILSSCASRLLLDLRFSVFDDSQVKVSIFQFERETAPDHMNSRVRFSAIASVGELDSLQWSDIPTRHFLSSYQHIFDTSWSPKAESIVKKLRAKAVRLGDILDVSFGFKLATINVS